MSVDEKLVISDNFLQNVEDIESSLNMAYLTLDALVATQKISQESPSVIIDVKLRSVEERMRQLGDVIAKLRSDANSLIEEYQSQEENMPDLNEADIEGEIEIVVLENIEIVESGNEREHPLVELGPGAPVCPG